MLTCRCTDGVFLKLFTIQHITLPLIFLLAINPNLVVCDDNKCDNGGVCHNTFYSYDQSVSYFCDCPIGFFGECCELTGKLDMRVLIFVLKCLDKKTMCLYSIGCKALIYQKI